MNSRLYPRLAWQNLRKNGKFYFPYILTIIGTSAAFYIMLALNGAKDLPNRIRYSYLSTFVMLGTLVIGLFAIIFLFYTNSFLMKRRNKELGLYNILGMGKKHIAKVLIFETIYTALLGIGGGVIFGITFQKLATLLLYRIMRFDVPYGFYIFYEGIAMNFIFFLGILALNLLVNLRRIHVQNPIELLHGGEVGEKEPRTKWIFAVLGVICLGGGYYIAVSTTNAMDALTLYFVAVILVIIGTYCLFTAVSIVILKLLRKNKKFYYKTKNFIGISGMLYRMKRNAVGLANICILSSMVLVMVSSTLALFLGTEEGLKKRYPADIVAEVRYDLTKEDSFRPEDMMENIAAGIENENHKIDNSSSITSLSFATNNTGNYLDTERENFIAQNAALIVFVTKEEYERITGEKEDKLDSNEVLLYSQGKPIEEQLVINFANAANPKGEKRTFKIKKELSSFPSIGGYSAYLTDVYYVVVSNYEILSQLYTDQKAAYGDYASSISWQALFNIDGTAESKMECAKNISDVDRIHGTGDEVGSWEWYSVESRDANREDMYSLNGGFFFLGMFLGLLFIMATVLIIYYKQISEGYEDREKFQIMQKVGLDKKAIKKSINNQVLVVFFMPLAVAAIHIAFNFRLVTLLLTLFQITNKPLILICTLGTVLVFMAIYGIVYALTARAYYKIVS